MGGGNWAEAGFNVPAPGGIAPELACGTWPAEVSLGVFPVQPGKESGELVSLGDIGSFLDG